MLNIIGLVLDIIGVVLLFFYEPPKEEYGLQSEAAPSQDIIDKLFREKRILSKAGLGLLVLGFGFQLVSNFCN